MLTHEFDLDNGIVSKNVEMRTEKVHKHVVLRALTAADIFDAQEESEKMVSTESGGVELVSSPALVGRHILRRQIVKLGEINGPLDIVMLRKLSAVDLSTLQLEAEKFDGVIAKKLIDEAAARGRIDGDGEGAGAGGGES